MILIVGGTGQGKLAYALARTGLGEDAVARTVEEAYQKPVFDGVARWIRAALRDGIDPDAALDALLAARPDVVLLMDEVGCGVVPIDREERLWREQVGRTACRLAERAQSVVRVLCGLPMALKGTV